MQDGKTALLLASNEATQTAIRARMDLRSTNFMSTSSPFAAAAEYLSSQCNAMGDRTFVLPLCSTIVLSLLIVCFYWKRFRSLKFFLTPLHEAAQYGPSETRTLLMDRGASVDAQDEVCIL